MSAPLTEAEIAAALELAAAYGIHSDERGRLSQYLVSALADLRRCRETGREAAVIPEARQPPSGRSAPPAA